MKFYNDEFIMDEACMKMLETKKAEFKVNKAGRKGVYITMMTTHGVKSNKYSTAIVDHNLTIKCLFE
jgi:hypothetical protein